MRVQNALWLLTALTLASLTNATWAVTVQTADNVLADGSAFLWVEGESASDLGGVAPQDSTMGFIVVDTANPFKTITEDAGGEVIKGGLDVLPADTNASGGAAIFQALEGTGAATATATWEVQFALPGTYYLYTHWTMYSRESANNNYGNEDSFYVPPAFNANSRSDWIGFEGVDEFGDPMTGDGDRDGYIDGFATLVNIMSAGDVTQHNSTDEDFWDGQFHWIELNRANNMGPDGAFVSFSGMGIQYAVSEADVGTVLTYEISSREPYGAIDGLLFSTSPTLLEDMTQEQMDELFLNPGGGTAGDVNGDGTVDAADIDAIATAVKNNDASPQYDVNSDGAVNDADRLYLVGTIKNTYIGDANLDGEFNSGDFVHVFTVGEYEDATAGNSGWADGDWDGNLDFDSSDFVAAFTEGGYETGPKGAVSAVPEPSTLGLLMVGLAVLAQRCRRGT